MTGEEILAYGEELIDDTFGSTDYIMMNIAYREVLAERPWRFLVKWDDSQDFTSQVTLPTDFNSTLPDKEGHGHLFVGTPNHKYLEIDIKEKINYENITGFFYIDRANNRIVFTGNAVDSGKVKLPYIFDPADIAETTSPTFGFKKGFQPIIAYKMAALYPITEQEEKARSYRAENQAEYTRLFNLMILDDARQAEYATHR
jgi:hypothetical protein